MADQQILDVLPRPRPARPYQCRRGPWCRAWLGVPGGPRYAGRSRLVCIVPAGRGHERHRDRGGWSWVTGDRLPTREWVCAGRDPATGEPAHPRARVIVGTEDAVRVKGWHVGWWEDRPDPLCPDCAS